jgi:hypothetical protein
MLHLVKEGASPATETGRPHPSQTAKTREYSLELGLSTWMQRNGVGPDDCLAAMLAIRGSLLAVADMDARSEPMPLHGRSPEIDVATFAGYLADLFMRATAACACELPVIVDRVSEHLAS